MSMTAREKALVLASVFMVAGMVAMLSSVGSANAEVEYSADTMGQ